MKPVRVVHLLLSMDVGGLERVALDLVRRADTKRFEARIVCLRATGALAAEARALGVTVEDLGAGGTLDGLVRLVRRLRQLRPAVLHTHNPGPHRLGVLARSLAGVPVLVHTKHGRNRPRQAYAVLSNRLAALLSDAIVTVSDDAAQVAREVEHVPAGKIRRIHNGIDPGEAPPAAGWGPWAARAITVARLNRIKDQPTLFRAVRRVVDACPEFRLEVVGDGEERLALERLVDELGLRKQITLHGYRSDVQELLRRPQVFVLSSVSEGVALTLLEAMGAGLPVVATDVGGNREVVTNGVTGVLVPPSSPEALAEAILGLVRQPDRALALGQAGRTRLEEAFDLRQTVRTYEELYLELLARRGYCLEDDAA